MHSTSPALTTDAALDSAPLLIAARDPELTRGLATSLRLRYKTVRCIYSVDEAVVAIRHTTSPTILLLEDRFLQEAPAEFSAALLAENLRCLWTILLEPVEHSGPTGRSCHDRLSLPFTQDALTARLQAAQSALRLMRRLAQQHHATLFHAEHDALTGLWNRETVLQHLHAETDRSQRQSSPLALILLDLDYFSHINLEYGYDTGDRVLQELGMRFRGFLRSYDLVGRYGEDEFLFALPHTTSAEASTFTDRLRQLFFSRPYTFGRGELVLTASIGISHSFGRSPLIVLREAERALAAAKASGRDRQRIYSELEPASLGNQGSRLRLVLPPDVQE